MRGHSTDRYCLYLPEIVPREVALERLPEHKAPPALDEIIIQGKAFERNETDNEIYLYHGTNCYRRWEIHRVGSIQPGRSGYSFYCNSEEAAFNYARNACLRDIRGGAPNSLISEPVVLKVRFSKRTWMQVDFVQELSHGQLPIYNVAVLGPILLGNIVEILHCSHGRAHEHEPIRTFADGTFLSQIKKLRQKDERRTDSWLLKQAQQYFEYFNFWLHGKPKVEVTIKDELHKLTQIGARLRT